MKNETSGVVWLCIILQGIAIIIAGLVNISQDNRITDLENRLNQFESSEASPPKAKE